MSKIATACAALLAAPTLGVAQEAVAPEPMTNEPMITEPMTNEPMMTTEPMMAEPMMDMSDWWEIQGRDFIVAPYSLSTGELDDADVYGPDGEQIGEVEGFLGDRDNNVVAVIVETEGFLGLGDEDVVVGLDQVELVGDRFVTALTEEQLEALPKWDD